jgi:two-component system response regulator RegX3
MNASPSNSTQTVLVVEDEESFVDALQVGLKREGFRVEIARDGKEALDIFDVSRISCSST